MPTATLITNWPAMKVTRKGLLHWLTADEKATGQLTFDDSTGVSFRSIDLPPMLVTVHPFQFPDIATVAPCTATGVEVEGTLVIELDAEAVNFENGGIVAKSMPATATYTAADGSMWSGPGVFPDCPLVSGVAQPVTASFVLEKR